jgi:hypothetical protein
MWMVALHTGIHYRPYDSVTETLERPLRGPCLDRRSGYIDLGVCLEVWPDTVDRPLWPITGRGQPHDGNGPFGCFGVVGRGFGSSLGDRLLIDETLQSVIDEVMPFRPALLIEAISLIEPRREPRSDGLPQC